MGRILFITSTRIGDAVLSSGVLARLLEVRPGARVTVAAGPLAAPLFRAVPGLEDLVVMTKRKSGGHWFDLWRRTVGRPWDLVVDFRGSGTAYALWANRRRVAGRPRTDLHKVAEAAALLGFDPPPAPRLWIDDAATAAADAALADLGPFLALSPAASAPFKEWPPERFAKLAAELTGPSGPLSGCAVIAFGGPADRDRAVASLAGLPAGRTANLAGRLDLLAAAAALARAKLFVGNDSGLMHLAAAGGAPTLGLFGPTDERVYGPWGARAASVRAGGPVDARARASLRHASGTLLTDLDIPVVADAAHALLGR